jgi:lysozyme
MSKTKTGVTGAGAVIAITVPFLMGWEGMDPVAKRDMIGTGHPITYCNGLTSVDGDVRVGQRFTKQECEQRLALALPKYLNALNKCIKVPVPRHAGSALLDGSFNAGSAAVCRSPMLTKMNAGNVEAGCNSFVGWYVRSDGQVRKGLVARRSGIGDGRKSERDLCLEGLKEPRPTWYVAAHSNEPVEDLPPLADYRETKSPVPAKPKPTGWRAWVLK